MTVAASVTAAVQTTATAAPGWAGLGWAGTASSEAADAGLRANPTRFPRGMKAAGDYIHGKGLKFRIRHLPDSGVGNHLHGRHEEAPRLDPGSAVYWAHPPVTSALSSGRGEARPSAGAPTAWCCSRAAVRRPG
ncbi:hypothetical protein GT021_34235 [Streptomyces sp. SID5470]|nr:hypothetical protein [Streptomyces sp. SID5470]